MTITQVPLFDRMIKILLTLPSPEEVLAIEITPEESERIDYLTERKKAGTITAEEWDEARQYIRAERYVQLAKTRALLKLKEKRAA